MIIIRYKVHYFTLGAGVFFFLIHGEERFVLGISRMDLRNHSLQSMCVYLDGREDKMNCFVPCKGIQDILGLSTLGRGFRIPGTDFTFLTSDTGFFELNSDSKTQDCGSTSKNFPVSGILLIIYMGKPFGKLQKMWAVFSGNAIFPLF